MLITILCLEQLTIRYMIWRALRRILVSVDFCGIDCVLMGPFSLATSAILLLLCGSSALCLWGSDSLLCICGHHSGVVLDGTGGYEHACILWQGHHEFALPMCGGQSTLEVCTASAQCHCVHYVCLHWCRYCNKHFQLQIVQLESLL